MTAALHLLTSAMLGAAGLAATGRGLALVIGPLGAPPLAVLGVVFVGCCVVGLWAWRKGRAK